VPGGQCRVDQGPAEGERDRPGRAEPPDGGQVRGGHMGLRMAQPRFANARSVRNAIDRMRLRQANRLVAAGALVGKDDLIRLEPADITVSRVFGAGP
jgi:AAA lid domain